MKEIHKQSEKLEKLVTPQKLKSEKIYTRSQFAYTLKENGCFYLFNTLTKQCLESDRAIPDGEISPAEIESSDFLTEMLEGRFIVPSDFDECQYYEGIVNILRITTRQKGYIKYTILPTTACNARCVYCFEEGMKQVSMTDELADKTAEFILNTKRADKKINIEWFGGEPLLGAKQISRICSKLKSAGVDFKANMVSNASLITDEIIDNMVNLWNLTGIQISMDGSESEYIRRKCYPSYKDYYNKIISDVGKLSQKGIFVNIRCNIDNENLKSLPEFINDLDKALPDKKNVSAYFIPLNHIRDSKTDAYAWSECFKAVDKMKELGFDIYEEPSVLYFRINSCIADDITSSVVIAPDGKLYNCECCDEGTSFGNIFEGVTAPEILSSYQNYGKTREKCSKCVFLPECTSFSKCPIVDQECDKVREMIQKRVMRNLINGLQTDNADNIFNNC